MPEGVYNALVSRLNQGLAGVVCLELFDDLFSLCAGGFIKGEIDVY